MRGMPKEYQRWAKLALAKKWTISRTGSTHFRWQPPGGGPPIISGGTPHQGKRGYLNLRAALKRAGLFGAASTDEASEE